MSVTETIHATCVARGDHAVLLTGRSGAGKSDLALRLIDRGWLLVSDDYTCLAARDGALIATPPATIAGKIEIRGIGIVALPHLASARVVLVCDLDGDVVRMPAPATRILAGIALPCVALAGLEPSAPLKLERLLPAGETPS